MPHVRKFDHDEARRRHAAGEATTALAVEYGVSYHAVWRVVHPNGPIVEKRARERYYDRHRVPCEGCGKPCLALTISGKAARNPDGRALCVQCRGTARTERLRFDAQGKLVAVRCVMLNCANGERWQPPDHFPRGSAHRHIRKGGIHGQCRACQTRARREHRNRHPEQRAEENRRAREARRKVPVS